MEQPNSEQPIRPTAAQPTWGQAQSQLDDYAERLRVMLPAAPPGLMDGYMRFAPWIAMIFGGLGVLFTVLALVLGAVAAPFFVALGISTFNGTAAVLFGIFAGLISAALEFVGGYLMLRGRVTGWWLLAFGLALSILGSLIRVNLFGLVLALAIGYIHLAVKPNYK
jgi:hypothetical protein